MSVLDLGIRCLLCLHGPDSVRYLNGQVTQDVRLLLAHPQSALASCVTDAKGRLQGFVTLYLHETQRPSLWIEAPIELRELLLARLSRYLIADDAEIEDISDQYHLTHHLSHSPTPGDFTHSRLGVPGFDRWIAAHETQSHTDRLSIEEAERIRIENGTPAWGHELQEGMLPPEAGLDATAISYQKGCYIGQEVISRIKSVGKVNRRLFQFSLEASDVCTGAILLDESGAEVGELTSVAHPYALGYVSKKAFGQTRFTLRLPDGSLRGDAARIRN